ncbi:MAG: hypothetical protein BGO09_06255 [Bacteroidetes bacterium 47-18]|nr:MAG: hypothetical protein BGO09_06255 [Bacteroidetes bacterium 47-18]
MFGNIKNKITEYLQLRFEIVRLEVIEKLANAMAYIIFVVMSILVSFIVILFLSIGLAEWVCEMMDSRFLGYFIVGCALLLFIIIVFMSSKHIIRFFGNKFVSILTATKKKSSGDNEDEAVKHS